MQRFIILKIKNKVRLQYAVNNIDRDDNINEQYKEFVREFRNITNNQKILYDYQINKNLILDKIIDEEISTSNDDSFIKEIGKKFIKNLRGQGIDEYRMIKIDKDALEKNIFKIRYNNARKLNNKYLHDDMIISNNMKNAILKNANINKSTKNEYHVYNLLNKYKNDDKNLFISSYLAGITSTYLYNIINQNLYNKLKNNEITKRSYYNIKKIVLGGKRSSMMNFSITAIKVMALL